MKKSHRLSFHLHWITICCFLLPFFYDSCTDEKTDSVNNDSSVVTPIQDSISDKNLLLDTDVIIKTDSTTNVSKDQKDAFFSETIIKKYPISEFILMPSAGTHTGIAGIVNTIPLLSLFATTIAFLLLTIGLLAKLIDKNALKTFIILETCAIIFIIMARPPFFDYDALWGYWLCIVCISALILLDIFIIYRQKKQNI